MSRFWYLETSAGVLTVPIFHTSRNLALNFTLSPTEILDDDGTNISTSQHTWYLPVMGEIGFSSGVVNYVDTFTIGNITCTMENSTFDGSTYKNLTQYVTLPPYSRNSFNAQVNSTVSFRYNIFPYSFIVEDDNGVWAVGQISRSINLTYVTQVIHGVTNNQIGLIQFEGDVVTNSSIIINANARTLGEFYRNNGSATDPTADPYNGAGNSDTGGGGGTFDGSSDPVPIPNLPPIGATDTGFISLFVPTMAQLNQVSSYLWSNFFDLATFKKIFEDPMDCILGLSVVPLTIPTSGNAQITVGNVELSGITLPLASQQYVELDCGTVDFTDKFFGSYLDQDPYTKMALFVPYSGVHAVNADDIMGKVIGLKYHIDILTGSLVAFVMCGDSVLYEYNGACASNIPVNSINYASTIENAIRIAVNIGTTVATAGAAAPMTGAEAAGREAARTFGTAVNMAGSTAEGILSLKPNIDRAGSLGGTTGLMGNQKPYFIITRPRLCKPKDQNKIKGYPSFIETTVGDLVNNGYTEFDSIILEGLYLTNAEKEELLTILKSGVYL